MPLGIEIEMRRDGTRRTGHYDVRSVLGAILGRVEAGQGEPSRFVPEPSPGGEYPPLYAEQLRALADHLDRIDGRPVRSRTR